MTEEDPDWPPPAHYASLKFDTTAFLSHLTGWALAAAITLIPVLLLLPRYEQLLAEYKADTPAPTQVMLITARWIREHGVVLVPIALVHCFIVARWYPRSREGPRRWYRLILTLCVCLIFGTVILALFLPIASITDTLIAPKP